MTLPNTRFLDRHLGKALPARSVRRLLKKGVLPEWIVVGLIGDSNILGGGGTVVGPQQLPGQQDAVHPRVWALSQSLVPVPARMPIGEFEGSLNVDLSQALGRTLGYYFGRNANILLVQCAAGGTSFGGNNWNPGDALYNDAVTRMNAALALDGAWAAGMLCFFGNIDAADLTNTQEFVDYRFLNFVDALREDIDPDVTGLQDTLPVVVGTIKVGTYKATINNFFRNLPKQRNFVACIEGEDLRTSEQEAVELSTSGGDAIHYASYARRELGRRFAAGLMRARTVNQYDRPMTDDDVATIEYARDLVTVGASPPASPENHKIWYDTAAYELNIYDSPSWLSVPRGIAFVGDSPPISPIPGEQWWNSDDGQLYIYYDDGSSEQWVSANSAIQGEQGVPGPAGSPGLITDDSITYAKIQNVSAASRLLGRGDSGSGDPQEITLGTNLSMSGTTLNATGGGSGIDQLTGDVTAGPGSGSQAATIANDAVTNAKLANMAEATLKGRADASGTGDPVDLTATQARTILNVADGATANASDASLRDRTTHTGEQAISTVTGLQTALDAKAALPTLSIRRWVFSDFHDNTTLRNLPFIGAAIASGTGLTSVNLDDDFGVLRIASSTSANSGYRFLTLTNLQGRTGLFFRGIIGWTGTDFSADVIVRMGFRNLTTVAEPNHGIYMQSEGDQVVLRCAAASSRTSSASAWTVPALNTLYIFEIEQTTATTAAMTIRNMAGSVLDTLTVESDVPSGTGQVFQAGIIAHEVPAAAARNLILLDYMGLGPAREPLA